MFTRWQFNIKDRGLNKTDKLFVGRGVQPCAPTENAEVIKFLFLSSKVRSLELRPLSLQLLQQESLTWQQLLHVHDRPVFCALLSAHLP